MCSHCRIRRAVSTALALCVICLALLGHVDDRMPHPDDEGVHLGPTYVQVAPPGLEVTPPSGGSFDPLAFQNDSFEVVWPYTWPGALE